jgi:2Fe-2S ferredoxin
MTTKSGSETVLDGSVGLSVMEVIRMSGSDELLALCGGCRSCATCHVFVDPAFADRIPPASAEELELLDSSEYKRDTSRLACQIAFTDALDGLRVTIAPDE